MKTIYFITTNTAKYKGLAKRFKSLDVELKQHEAELSELQLMSSKKIIKHKLQQAKKLLPNKKVLVDDRGFYIQAFNGFPGPLVKPVLQTIGIQGLLQLMKGQSNRQASFISAIGYYEGKKDHYFFDEEVGQVVLTPKGSQLRGWTELLHIFSPTTFPQKTLAELSDEEWDKHIDTQARNDCRKQLIDFLYK
jgi:XTP/dITP diphosphohydrolase